MEQQEKLHQLFVEKKLTLGIAESCTGGRVASKITKHPGASEFLKGCIVCYSEDTKRRLLKVPADMLSTHGAVSEPVVQQMAKTTNKAFNSQLSLAITGIAGPDGATDTAPVGTVYIAIASGERILFSQQFKFDGDREEIIEQASDKAINLLITYLGG